MNKHELENRLIEYAIIIIRITSNLPRTRILYHLSGQLMRSGTSVALNFGEARSAESRKDFIHKLKVIIKELRETHICLKIIIRLTKGNIKGLLKEAIRETNELLSIFVASVLTAQKNQKLKLVNNDS